MIDPTARLDTPDADDARLLARLAAGDERALGSLYDSYGTVVYGLAFAITQDAPSAESVVTDAFAVIWRDARTVARPAVSLFSWLSTTVRTLALQRRPAEAITVTAVPPVASGIALAIERMTPLERQCVELAYFGGATRAGIARALGESEVNIAIALRTAMEGLRDLLPSPAPQATPRMVASS